MAAAATPLQGNISLRGQNVNVDLENANPQNNNPQGPDGSMLGKFYCRILIGKYKREAPFENSNWTPHSNIVLPLPDVLRDTTSVKYGNIDQETVGDFFNMDALTGVGGALYRGVGSAISTGIGNVGGAGVAALIAAITKGKGGDIGGKLGSAANQALQNTFAADKLQSAIEQKVGVAPNPNPSVTFEGPQLRDFSFTWTFYPTKKEESDKIFNIIKLLKQTSLPSQTVSGSGALLNYPDTCQLNFFPWDNNPIEANRWYWSENSIIRIKKCFMSSVDVDYNPSNVPGFFNDNRSSPVAIRLTINFTEIEYLLSQDWGSDRTGVSLEKLGLITTVVAAAGITSPALAAGIAGAFILNEVVTE